MYLISFASVRSLPFLPFIVPILAWNVPLMLPIFLKRSLLFSLLLFSSIPLHCLFKRVFLSLPSILWNSGFHWISFHFSLAFNSLLSSAICKASSDNYFIFLHFFFFGLVLVTASCTVLWTSIPSCSGTLSTGSNLLSLFITSSV